MVRELDPDSRNRACTVRFGDLSAINFPILLFCLFLFAKYLLEAAYVQWPLHSKNDYVACVE